MLVKRTEHLHTVKLLIRNNLMKNMDKVKHKDIYGILRTLESMQYMKPIVYDLLAAQFAR